LFFFQQLGFEVLAFSLLNVLNDFQRLLPLDLIYVFYTQVLKSVVAKFNASQLITQRQQVSLLVRKELIDRARDFNIILDDVAITELTFGKEYAAAVEAKQVRPAKLTELLSLARA
jgi:regulator of protease activity HflC (stomatin/prohibitin superfamily)